jgi:hypothetical protein
VLIELGQITAPVSAADVAIGESGPQVEAGCAHDVVATE